MRTSTTYVSILVLSFSLGLFGCGDDGTSPGTDSGGTDATGSDSGGTDATGTDTTGTDTTGTDTTGADATGTDVTATDVTATDVTATDAPTVDAPTDVQVDVPVTGCVEDPTVCGEREMCCSGVPYPPAGICQEECPMRSDRNAKQSFESIDEEAALERLANLQITEWSYNSQPDVRHVGPMAQDFHNAFGLGGSDEQIHPVDANGVTIAAVQALYRRVQRLEEENQELRSQIESR